MSTTSIGPEPDRGGNESHGNADGMGNKTLGENGTQDPPVGAGDVPDEATARLPHGPGGAVTPRQPDVGRGTTPRR